MGYKSLEETIREVSAKKEELEEATPADVGRMSIMLEDVERTLEKLLNMLNRSMRGTSVDRATKNLLKKAEQDSDSLFARLDEIISFLDRRSVK